MAKHWWWKILMGMEILTFSWEEEQESAGDCFFGKGNGQFDRPDSAAFVSAALSEDTDALSFDANGDDFPDLLIGSGGMHQFFDGEPGLQDRLYLNDGNGKFTISADALPNEAFSTGSLTQGDFNTDGITDIFVGGRVVPGQYPIAPGGRIWIGDGKGKFTDQTASLAPDFKNLGMITDSGWADLDGDGQDELILVATPCRLRFFPNQQILGRIPHQHILNRHKWGFGQNYSLRIGMEMGSLSCSLEIMVKTPNFLQVIPSRWSCFTRILTQMVR
ncbi:VCBS repeat-containing protein [Algoriphagus boritolerans]|uniref:FG-GAP repeat domain-containing protein n=1 Tax=Algoriphagus boritolerans TaxID=308111 RepID=UPI002FCE3FF0